MSAYILFLSLVFLHTFFLVYFICSQTLPLYVFMFSYSLLCMFACIYYLHLQSLFTFCEINGFMENGKMSFNYYCYYAKNSHKMARKKTYMRKCFGVGCFLAGRLRAFTGFTEMWVIDTEKRVSYRFSVNGNIWNLFSEIFFSCQEFKTTK